MTSSSTEPAPKSTQAPAEPAPKPTQAPAAPSSKKSWVRDAVVILAIAAVALVAWWGISRAASSSSSYEVEVRDGNGTSTYLPLNEDARYVAATDLGTNTIVIQGGTVHIEDADCKNKDCEKQGTITKPGQMLICLPHKLYVQIVDEGTGSQEGSSLGGTADPASTGASSGSTTSGDYDAVSE